MIGQGTPDLAVVDRRARVVSAALRAAYAWTVRDAEQRAFGELARMTGVVMHELGPGIGPTTPIELVRCLRQPLGFLLPNTVDTAGGVGDGIDGVVLLDNSDRLADGVYDIGSDYVTEVFSGLDPGHDWLPSWSWMRANDVERELFARLIATGSPADYQKARRFIVEHPAGDVQELTQACRSAGATKVAKYVPIPDGQSYVATDGGRWWWPCPECRWPMRVNGQLLRCRYGHHRASYQIVDPGGGVPRLLIVEQEGPRGRRAKKPPKARAAAGALQVEQPVWQFVVVPGATEIRIFDAVNKPGVKVDLYPGFDRYDLQIIVGEGKDRWDVDVKEHSSVEGLLRHVHEKPPAARFIVLPDTHRGHLHAVTDALPNYTVLLESRLIADVQTARQRSKRRPS